MAGLTPALSPPARPSGMEGGAAACADLKSGAGPPPSSAPGEIQDAWLRFHEMELCQALDTYFVFHENGFEVWCRIEDERAFQRFSELVAPLRARYRVTIYATRPPAEKKTSEEKGPPPSLWTNSELRAYLQDPFSRGIPNVAEMPRPPSRPGSDPEYMLKQRMIMFADQTIDWAKRVRRYGGDLPALADAAFDEGRPGALRGRARAACLAHAQAMARYAEKLIENLSLALPKGSRKSTDGQDVKKPESAASTPRDASCELAASAASVAGRVYRFIHPIHYTVELSDLREPSLIESIKKLQKRAAAFERIVKK